MPHTKSKAVPSRALDVSKARLRTALKAGEFGLVYQPIISCQSSCLVGYEALVRWHHPDAGIVMPDRFIEAMENCGLIDHLTYVVVEMALTHLAEFQSEKRDAATLPFLAVNISAESMATRDFANQLTALCISKGVRPTSVILELTETAALTNPLSATRVMRNLRSEGFRLSLDDFGTGYSSMLQLFRLPFTEVKIDRAFVAGVAQSAEARAIIEATVGLALTLGLKVVAEGVEDAATLDYLRATNCDMAQGYFIARPLNAAALEIWKEQNHSGCFSQDLEYDNDLILG